MNTCRRNLIAKENEKEKNLIPKSPGNIDENIIIIIGNNYLQNI